MSVGAGDSCVPVSINLDGLRPNTRYHFRAVASNETGTARSLDRSFRTTREPTGISIALTPSRVVWGGGLTVIGRLAGSALGGTRLALERQAFPFSSGFSEVATTTAGSTGHVPLQRRLAVRDHPVPRDHAHAQAGLERDPHGVERAASVGARARSRGRRRARIEGAIWPRVAAGRVSLQKRSPRGRWAVVRRAAAKALDANRSRYRFTVRKPQARTPREPLPRRRAGARRRRARARAQPRRAGGQAPVATRFAKRRTTR